MPKLLKLTPSESEALNELASEWGMSASGVLKRLLADAYAQHRRKAVRAC